MVMGSKRKMKPVTVEVHRSVLQMTQTHHSSFTLATPITSTNKVYFSPPPSFPTQECTDLCCNASTCQLVDGAQCCTGDCCNSTCQYKAYGTTCRAADGECDIAEYCSGDSGECPTDDHKLDGTACASNTGYCYEGVCPSHDSQCQFHFGSGVFNCGVRDYHMWQQFTDCFPCGIHSLIIYMT